MKLRILASTAAAVLAIVLVVPASATVHVIDQIITSFVPDDITIVQGDTVRWVHHSQAHTVTSGTGSADPNVGDLFDAPLDLTHPTFQYVFTDVGDVHYFCRPHELMGMDGVVHVQADQSVSVNGDVAGAGPVLRAPYPNPFNPRATISFALATAGSVQVGVYGLDGRCVRVLLDGGLAAGEHQVSWNGVDGAGHPVAAGSYVVKLDTPQGARLRTVTLVK
jgi:plastocyanin